jgi:polar amino acid transport system ATP-binding protein
MVFQSFNLFPHMSVLRNVAFPRSASSAAPAMKRARPHAARPRRPKDKAHQHPGRCSGGQQQRIAIVARWR